MNLESGSYLRPLYSFNRGTIGVFAHRNGTPGLLTCDHVVKSYLADPESGPIELVNDEGEVGRFNGASLTNSESPYADVAFVEMAVPSTHGARLPMHGPADELRPAQPPVPGAPLFVWSRGRAHWLSGTVADGPAPVLLPHGRYGMVRYQLLMCITLTDLAVVPMPGDSGGIIVDESGAAIGLLCAGPTHCVVSADGPACIAYGVPLVPAISRLSAVLVTA